MKVIMFQPRFAPLVASGAKPHTIRKERKNPIKVGDELSLRKWNGKPYRSKQNILRKTVCTDISKIKIYDSGALVVTGFYQIAPEQMARNDGFKDFQELLQWFRDTHGLPFEGVLIEWKI